LHDQPGFTRAIANRARGIGDLVGCRDDAYRNVAWSAGVRDWGMESTLMKGKGSALSLKLIIL
jgi:hypothetical protein